MINWNEVLKTAHISDDGLYRYSLSRVWDRSKPMVLWIMLNPSTADGIKDDRTIRKIGKFSDDFGFGGMWVGNLFAFRATDPSDVKKRIGEGGDVIGELTDKWLKLMSTKSNTTTIVFGWGKNANEINDDRPKKIIGMFPEAKALALNKDDSPAHPLFLKGTLVLRPYIDLLAKKHGA